MSTTTTGEGAKRHFTPAEVDAALASAPHPRTALPCEELCAQIQEDMTDLDDIDEIPVKFRARYRMALLKELRALRVEMEQQGCPEC